MMDFTLGNTKITPEVMEKVVTYWSHITYIDIILPKHAHAGVLMGLPRLSKLAFLSVTMLSEEGIEPLLACKSLKELYVTGSTLDTTACKRLMVGLTNLEKLGLSETPLDSSVLKIFIKMERLDYLFLRDNDLKGEGIELISQCGKLTELHLCENSLTDKELRSLGGMKNLVHLSLEDNKITDYGLSHLNLLINLIILNLSRNKGVTLKGVEKLLPALPHLREIQLVKTSIEEGEEVNNLVKKYPGLEVVLEESSDEDAE